jgi:hypothetical protein
MCEYPILEIPPSYYQPQYLKLKCHEKEKNEKKNKGRKWNCLKVHNRKVHILKLN